MPLYEFDLAGGGWRHIGWWPPGIAHGMDAALEAGLTPSSPLPAGPPEECLVEAGRLASLQEARLDPGQLRTTDAELVPFLYVCAAGANPRSPCGLRAAGS